MGYRTSDYTRYQVHPAANGQSWAVVDTESGEVRTRLSREEAELMAAELNREPVATECEP